jgi:hypothetical protein
MFKLLTISVAALGLLAKPSEGRATSASAVPTRDQAGIIHHSTQKSRVKEGAQRKHEDDGLSMGRPFLKKRPHKHSDETSPKTTPSGVTQPKVEGQIDI